MDISNNFFQLADKLAGYTKPKSNKVEKLIQAALEFEDCWSKSWLGYHSRIYYRNFVTPPAGAHFSQEWGIEEVFGDGTTGDWVEYQYATVVQAIESKAGSPDIDILKKESKSTKDHFEEVKEKGLSLIYSTCSNIEDKYFKKIVKEIESLKVLTQQSFVDIRRPTGQLMSRDAIAIHSGQEVPPHIAISSLALSFNAPFEACSSLLKKNNITCESY
jgi:hypothetical protein